MRAEIISIGTELLLGEIVDTNAAWLAQQLASTGMDVFFRTTVGELGKGCADALDSEAPGLLGVATQRPGAVEHRQTTECLDPLHR